MELLLIIHMRSRPETESIVSYLASLLSTYPDGSPRNVERLEILDLCTGTGCIPLLLHALLDIAEFDLCGVDISPAAINLARANQRHNVRLDKLEYWAEEQISFVQDDILEDSHKEWRDLEWDIVISNPPYISPKGFDNTTSRSVKNYEPKIALVPSCNDARHVDDVDMGDLFYPKVLDVAHKVGAKVLLMEVADVAQAVRVVKMVKENGLWSGVEIWRDFPAQPTEAKEEYRVNGLDGIRVRGEGNGRAVLAWKGRGDNMLSYA